MERKQKSSGKMEGVEEKRRKKAVRWSNNDILLLIELWEEKNDELRGARRNNHIYQEMLEALQRNGLNNITIEDIRNRIHNLTQKYRSEKKNVGTSGGSPSDWPFFDKIHAFLGKHPINNLDDYIEDSISQQEKIPEANLHEDDSGDALEDDSAAVEWLEDEFQESAEPAIPASVPSSTPKAAKPKKQKTKNFHSEILKRFDLLEERITEEEQRMREIEEEMLKEEKKRTELLQQQVEDAREMKNAFIAYLNSRV